MLNKKIQVDDCDLHFLKGYAWSPDTEGYPVTHSSNGRLKRKGKPRVTVKLYRVIMEPGPGQQVDHIDGDILNNRRSNLRVVDGAINQQNKTKLDKRNKTGVRGVRGVRWDADRRKYDTNVCVTTDGIKQTVRIGRFDTLDEAARAVCAWRREHMPGYICRCTYEGAQPQSRLRTN